MAHIMLQQAGWNSDTGMLRFQITWQRNVDSLILNKMTQQYYHSVHKAIGVDGITPYASYL